MGLLGSGKTALASVLVRWLMQWRPSLIPSVRLPRRALRLATPL